MTMQNTPLLMSRILGRGAKLDPNEEIVTLLENGTHRQTLKALARISRLLKNQEFKSNLLKASNREDIYNIILNEDSKLQ